MVMSHVRRQNYFGWFQFLMGELGVDFTSVSIGTVRIEELAQNKLSLLVTILKYFGSSWDSNIYMCVCVDLFIFC